MRSLRQRCCPRLLGIDEDRVLNRLLEGLYQTHQLIEDLGERQLAGSKKALSFFRFRNGIFRRQIYQRLNAVQKRRLHNRVGTCLEEIYGEERLGISSQLAEHFRIAHNWDKALCYSVQAAEDLKSSIAQREAKRHYRFALEAWQLASDRDLKLKARLLNGLGTALMSGGEYDEAIAAFEQVLNLDRANVPAAERGYALHRLGYANHSRGDTHKAVLYFNKYESLIKDLGWDARLLLQVSIDLSSAFLDLWKDACVWSVQTNEKYYRKETTQYLKKVRYEAEQVGEWEILRVAYLLTGDVMLSITSVRLQVEQNQLVAVVIGIVLGSRGFECP